MGIDSIKARSEKKSEWKSVRSDWERAIGLLDPEASREVIEATSATDFEGLEEFLTKNIDRLSEEEKNFILQSLRVKKFKLDNPDLKQD